MITWQQLAELPVFPEFYYLARQLFGANIALVSPDGAQGRVLGQGRELNPFCKAIERQPEGAQRCAECDAVHARLARKERKPIRYLCHAGLTDFIIPISVDGEIVAHLQCGQVLDRRPTAASWKSIQRRLDWIHSGQGELRKLYLRTTVIAPSTQKSLMSLLQLFANHVAIAHARQLVLDQDPRDRALSKALDFLRTHFKDPLNLDQVATAAGTSKRNLVRIFRTRTGATVLDHLHRFRIAQACDQLLQSHAQIAQIGLDCGFGSIQQFNRMFRKVKRTTPRNWRAKFRKTVFR
jgi:AraC-like DNA-binding protein